MTASTSSSQPPSEKSPVDEPQPRNANVTTRHPSLAMRSASSGYERFVSAAPSAEDG